MGSLLRRGADVRALYEALARDDDIESWARGVLESLAQTVVMPRLSIQTFRSHANSAATYDAQTFGYSPPGDFVQRMVDEVGDSEFGRVIRGLSLSEGVVRTEHLLQSLGADLDCWIRSDGLGDSLALKSTGANQRGIVLVLFGEKGLPLTCTQHERAFLNRAYTHLTNGATVRGKVKAEGHVSQDGRHSDCDDTWHALATGQVTLRRRNASSYALLKNSPLARVERALTQAERRACEECSLGIPFKIVAAELGLTQSKLSLVLTTAVTKLGLTSVSHALRMIAGLRKSARVIHTELLTTAESDIVRLLQQGLSNRDIALSRQSSERTVANQVASVLRKTGLPNRRAVGARLKSTSDFKSAT